MESGNKYLYTRGYFKILNLIQSNPDQNVFVICGGQGASKTISILQLLIQALLSEEQEASVLSSELSKMKRTVMRDYRKICKDWGVITQDGQFNKAESKHEYQNESYIDFLGADVNDVGKGFRRDILYINEANKMDIETAIQFISRAGLTIIDYNPDALFWGDELINESNHLVLTFQDNEFLPESERRSILDYKQKGFHNPDLTFPEIFNELNIKSKYWANRWRVYGLGLVGSLDGVVFDNWSIIQSIPDEAKLFSRGLDFGYSNDPTAIVDVYKYDGKLILDQRLFRTGMVNADIINWYKSNVQDTIYTIADSSEPKSIEEIKRAGVRIKGANKGRDSVLHGIQNLQQFELLVTARSVEMISELKKYTWDKDKAGNTINKPIDAYNHCVDAVRYGCESLLKPKFFAVGA